jgi:2-phosphosulfolactate phosphatase
MPESIEVLFTPADFDALAQRDLSETVCVVFDVLRATTSMLTALANGAQAVIPVEDIPEALEIRRQRPEVLLAGERHGHRILADQTGGVDFDLGNSPREYTAARVAGKTIVSTTTNGTRALRACTSAQATLVGALLNVGAVARRLIHLQPPHLVVVCSGTFEQTALEDVLAAGALLELLFPAFSNARTSDAVLMARLLYRQHAADLLAGLRLARNGSKLMENPELRDDVAFCARRDSLDLVAALQADGSVRVA